MANNNDSDAIEAVLIEVMRTHEDYRDGDLLVHWAVVGYVNNPNPTEEDPAHGYPMWFSNGEVPDHIAKGLFVQAMSQLA